MVQIRRQPGGPNDPTLRLVLTHALFGAGLGLCFTVGLVLISGLVLWRIRVVLRRPLPDAEPDGAMLEAA